MHEYLGILDVPCVEVIYVKIKADNREMADNKFFDYIDKRGYSKRSGEIYVIPLFAEFEII